MDAIVVIYYFLKMLALIKVVGHRRRGERVKFGFLRFICYTRDKRHAISNWERWIKGHAMIALRT